MDMLIEGLTEDIDRETSLALLAGSPVVRLAVATPGRVEIFPVNVARHEENLYLRTGAGTKLAAIAMFGDVAIEADQVDFAAGEAWSVVVHGKARIVDNFSEEYTIEDNVEIRHWQPAGKVVWVEVSIDEVGGRRFHRN